MEEAIGLRDDGLELCARIARQREMMGPPWSLLAVWWFWVQNSECRFVLAVMAASSQPAGDYLPYLSWHRPLYQGAAASMEVSACMHCESVGQFALSGSDAS